MKKDAAGREELFETMPIPKAVAKLSIPTVAACLVMILYNLADTFFVGQLGAPAETAAVTLAAPVLLAFNAVTNLFGVGCASVMSRALGVRDMDRVRRAAALGFYGALFSGLLFSAVCAVFRGGLLSLLGAQGETVEPTGRYLLWTVFIGAAPSMLNVVLGNLVRAEGSAMHAGIGTMSGCFLNILLDPLFIMPWGLDMGAAGAGLATCISNCVACGYFFVFLATRRSRTCVSIRPGDFRPDKRLVGDVFSIGIPASLQNLLNVTGMTILNNFMAAYGKEAVSAMGIAHKAAMVPMYISMGISQGIMPLVGYNYASGNRARMKETIRFTQLVAGGITIAITAVMFVFSRPLVAMFMEDAKIVEYGGTFLRGASLASPFLFFDFLAVAIFQACGMGKHSFVFALLRKIALEIPAMFVLNRLWPMYGLPYAPLVAETVLAAASFVILERIMRGETPDKTIMRPEGRQ